jgi:hypothetical protein
VVFTDESVVELLDSSAPYESFQIDLAGRLLVA